MTRFHSLLFFKPTWLCVRTRTTPFKISISEWIPIKNFGVNIEIIFLIDFDLFILLDPFPSQQQLIDHMSNQGNSSSSKEIHMISSYSIILQTRSQNYDKPTDKKEDHSSSRKAPSTGSPESSSTVPLTIKKPTLEIVFVSTQEYS